MTPITPNVMASPIAASSSTEPSEMPYQAFCTDSHSTRRFLIAPIAAPALLSTGSAVLGGRLANKPSES